MEEHYQQIIDEGYKVIQPPPPRKKGQRGAIKKGRARRLLERLDEKRVEILDFIYDFSKPFDNNQAERDIRMIKVKQKISGTFRSPTMAKFDELCADVKGRVLSSIYSNSVKPIKSPVAYLITLIRSELLGELPLY